MKKPILFLLALGFSYGGYAQTIVRNYGFENFDAMGRLIGWSPQNTQGQYSIRPVSPAHTGTVAMLIASKPDATAQRGTGLCNTLLGRDLLQGKKKVTISAYIKTEDLADGTASIWMQLNGPRGIIADKNCDDQSSQGHSDWTRYTIELPLTGEVQSIGFGCKMTGSGQAWYDDFQVLIDGVPVE